LDCIRQKGKERGVWVRNDPLAPGRDAALEKKGEKFEAAVAEESLEEEKRPVSL